MLFHGDENLLELVRIESRLAITSDSSIDMVYILHSCPLLNSIWDETMRVTAFGASVRFVTKDIALGGKILRKGNRIMLPQRQLHLDERVFGGNAGTFEATRFMHDAKLRNNPAYRPFGGGATLCPGRHFAKQTSLGFIVLLLRRFDITLNPVD